ncbi:transposase [Micromonospora echinofusca]|uniref:IS110 family transposase n=1 Tax=Micromonospora echinofusca TaxID=47858 RepID=UPI00344238B5
MADPGLGDRGLPGHRPARRQPDGEQVVDVPPKLSARARVFATGQGPKTTDATDAHSIALVDTRMAGLRSVVNDEQLALLRNLVGRRRSLGEDHTRMVSQLHPLLLDLIPGGAKGVCPPPRPRHCWPRSGPVTRSARPADGSPRS